jgi:hypothetical protein
MADHDIPLTGDDDLDDLPRTLRRERAAQEKRARERGEPPPEKPRLKSSDLGAHVEPQYGPDGYVEEEDPYPAVVRQLDIPFVHLMMFFLKAVLAAIPALILLGALIWLSGEILQQFFPWLIKMKILIQFPDV